MEGFMTGNAEHIETVIIGGGHAGLTMSYYLSQLGLEHFILERGRVAERWISERWDSFYFQFPNWTIELPGTSINLTIRTVSSPVGKLFGSYRTTQLS